MNKTSALVLALLLGSGLASAQTQPPPPGINRNPAYRELLPPTSRDDRDAPAPAPASTGPTNPAPASLDNMRR